MASANIVTKEQFDEVCAALWSEIEYQNNLARRTDDSEALQVPSYLTLGQVYLNKAAEDWALNAGDELALHGLRKVAGIFVRGMVYCGVRNRAPVIA
ncbi:hypothetical protein HFO15_19915 [Rhizobium laguerreae]|uniref:hypothetical protein n=1 Tax=Rhizobium laguerreae TaxID=1076926 RepID=UPI001C921A5B|nr:hypothetical protein [Rhizobium laguerreae]MBY3263895.1 hypothetical protein [Rhizobium laguerreae]